MTSKLKNLWYILLVVPLLLPLFVENQYYLHSILGRIFIYTILVASLDIVLGYIGDVSIGHASFFAIGAYTVAVLTANPAHNTDSALILFPQIPFVPALFLGILLSAFAGFVLGFPALRSRGPYLAIITIAYGLIIYTFINEQEPWTNGTKGISLEDLRLGPVSFAGNNFLYLVYPVLLAVIYMIHNLSRSHWGRAFEAIKYSSVGAECSGISRSYYKIWAFVLSAGIAGLAGGLFSQLDSYVAPNTFSYHFSVEILIALIFGGVRSRAGNLIGVSLYVILPEIFNQFNEYKHMIFGTTLLLVLFFLPDGLVGLLRSLWRRFNPGGYDQEREELERSAVNVEPLAGIGRPTGHALEVENVTMRFGGLTAVSDLTFRVAAGTIHGLIGPNGSGKSTMVNVLTGLYTPGAGQFRLFGTDLAPMKTHARARQGVARTFQNLQLFSDLTVLENVMVGFHKSFRSSLPSILLGLPSWRREEREMRVKSYALLRFVGLEAQAFELAGNLPYGQMRLLEIARALALSPSLLLLDEPAAGLTAAEIESMNEIIRKIRKAGISVLLIEHHMDMLMRVSDEVTVIDFGRKICEGKPADVQKDPSVIAAYLGSRGRPDARDD